MSQSFFFKMMQPIAFCTVAFFFVSTGSLKADDSVRAFLSSSAQTSYMQQGTNDLKPATTHLQQPVNSVVFQKTIDGIPLHGGMVEVVRDEAGQIVEVIDDSTEHLEFNNARPIIGANGAERLVALSLAGEQVIDAESELVWFRIGNTAKLAWEVTTEFEKADAPGSPTGMISVHDAETGELLSQSQFDTTDYYADGGLGDATGVYPRIVINNTIGAAGSRAFAAPLDAVVAFQLGCTGTLIADNVVLCARHCGVGAGARVFFGDNRNNPTHTAFVQSSILPAGNGSLLNGGDVAIVTLTAAVPANVATPMRLVDETSELAGKVCATVGYGLNGLGNVGHGFSSDGRRWGGENIIDRYGSPAGANGSNIISTDFDNGSNFANAIPGSSSTPLQFEATTAPGDSGGPVLVQVNDEWVIAGVLSGGTTANSVFGDISWWTGTAIYRTQIENRGGVFIGETTEHLDIVSVFRGVPVGGELSDAIASDNSYLRINPGFVLNSTEAPAWLIFEADLPTSAPNSLTLELESNANTPGLTATLESWNWNSNAYEVVDVSDTGFNGDESVTLDLTGNISDYVQPGSGAVRARVGWRRTSFTILFPWEVRLDKLIWVVE